MPREFEIGWEWIGGSLETFDPLVMGFSQSSLASRGVAPDAVLEALGLRRVGKFEDFPESRMTAALMPGGWFVVVVNRAEHEILREETLRTLSAAEGVELVASFVEEHVMVSEASGWQGGQRTWRVLHDAQIDREHLAVEGEPPAAFAGIRDRLLAEQETGDEEVDYLFDIPVEMARSLMGYRHDEDTAGLKEGAFEVLESAVPGKSFWQRLFGRG